MSVVSSSSKAVSHGGAGEAGSEAEAAVAAPVTLDDDDTSDDAPRSATANSKEKTPMCLVNELARYNKVIIARFDYSSSNSMLLLDQTSCNSVAD